MYRLLTADRRPRMKVETLKEILCKNGFEVRPIPVPTDEDLSEKFMCLQDDLDELIFEKDVE